MSLASICIFGLTTSIPLMHVNGRAQIAASNGIEKEEPVKQPTSTTN
jgi:hypothetical protein